MPKHVTLPGPPEPVVAHQANTLEIEGRLCHHSEHAEPKDFSPELLTEERPRDFEERSDPSVAYEVRHVRIPTSHRPHASRSVSKAMQKRKKKNTIPGLTCAPLRRQMQGCYAQKPSRAGGPKRRDSRGKLLCALRRLEQPSTVPRRARTARAAPCARLPPVVGCDTP